MYMFLRTYFKKYRSYLQTGLPVAFIILTSFLVYFLLKNSELSGKVNNLSSSESNLKEKLGKVEKEYTKLKNEDQYVINQQNKKEIENIQKTYKKAVNTYEKLLDLKTVSKDTSKLDELFSKSLDLLSQRNYATSDAVLSDLSSKIADEKTKISSSFVIPENLQSSNAPPSSGYSRQKVDSDIGSFMVDIVSADLNSTRVIVDTASDGTCGNDCPVLSLGDYVSRNGAFAGINGSYFCPATYPSCAGKTNSFDTLLMNKNKVYFNSDNNVYSTVPVVVFGSGWIRFIGRSLDWGRDTGADGVLANQPLLLSDGNIVFGGDGDPKRGAKGPRGFVGNKGSMVYIGVTHNATAAENAHVLKTLGMDNALNLDSGGSTALWYGGYKAGPGRNIPNSILFIRK